MMTYEPKEELQLLFLCELETIHFLKIMRSLVLKGLDFEVSCKAGGELLDGGNAWQIPSLIPHLYHKNYCRLCMHKNCIADSSPRHPACGKVSLEAQQ
jgi:hypothetical protein